MRSSAAFHEIGSRRPDALHRTLEASGVIDELYSGHPFRAQSTLVHRVQRVAVDAREQTVDKACADTAMGWTKEACGRDKRLHARPPVRSHLRRRERELVGEGPEPKSDSSACCSDKEVPA